MLKQEYYNKGNARAADAMAPCVTRQSTAVILTIQDEHVLVFPEEDIAGLVCSANALEILQSCAKPSIWGQFTAVLPVSPNSIC